MSATGRGGRHAAPRPVTSLSASEARRIAVAASGLAASRPTGAVNLGHARRVAERLAVVQMDAVNVLARAHEVPLFSRLGPRSTGLLARLVADGRLVEAWGHEASLVLAGHYPLLAWRRRQPHQWPQLTQLAAAAANWQDRLLAEVAAAGPVTARDLERGVVRTGPWWGWGPAKQALELLFWEGRLAARRRADFQREYDLPERVLPPAALAPPPGDEEARAGLLRAASRALGVATAGDLADYHRQSPRDAAAAIARLVEEGALIPVAVEGWGRPAYLDAAARTPRRVEAGSVVSPFDPLVWERSRTERVFGFRYRLEIYTPAHRRVHGYYVLPFLLADRLAARVDLKADRAAGVLRVLSAFAEPDAPGHTAEALAAELCAVAEWRGLSGLEVTDRGDLAPAVRAALGSMRGRVAV